MADMIVVATRPVSRYLEHIPRSAAAAAMTSLSRVAIFLSQTSGDPNAFPWHLLRPEHASAIRSWAALCHRAGSANAMLTALRGVLRWAERGGLMEAEELVVEVCVVNTYLRHGPLLSMDANSKRLGASVLLAGQALQQDRRPRGPGFTGRLS